MIYDFKNIKKNNPKNLKISIGCFLKFCHCVFMDLTTHLLASDKTFECIPSTTLTSKILDAAR